MFHIGGVKLLAKGGEADLGQVHMLNTWGALDLP